MNLSRNQNRKSDSFLTTSFKIHNKKYFLSRKPEPKKALQVNEVFIS